MEFGILGALEVRSAGEPVPIPGRHAPKLLAMLLLEAGRLVTVTRLVAVLWPKDPPTTARRQVQNVLAALRRALPEPNVIVTDGGGYRVALEGNDFDHRQFRRLRTSARDTDPAEAVRLLRRGLRLWRGPALSGLSGSAVAAAAAKLDEERLAAIEDRVELELELGEDVDLVGELRALARDNPYRQRAVGLLMRALYEDGRPREAVAEYEGLRQRLLELGLDPDVEVHRVYRRIRDGGTKERTLGPRVGPVPAQLPASPSTFTGRREQLAELDDLLGQGHNAAVVSAIAGMAGAGKTALALHWGHRMRDRFPDGQLYINLRGYDDAQPVPPIEALGRFLVALGQASTNIPADPQTATALYRSLLARRRMLVVLDNARTAEQVRPLLPGGAGNFAVVTSRDRLAGLVALDDATPIRLDALSPNESLELLADIVGARRLRAEPRHARRLAELCGYLPLALRIAGADLASRPNTTVADYAELLSADRLGRLALDDDPRAAVSHALKLSFDALDEPDRALLLRAAMFPGADFGGELARRMSGLGEATPAVLRRLAAAHLIEEHARDRYRLHDLTREYALDRGRREISADEALEVRTRCIDWYDENINSLVAAEGVNVLAALDAWRGHPMAWKLLIAASSFWRKGHSATTLLELCERWLPAVREIPDRMALPRLYNSIALLYRGLGRKHEAVDCARRVLDMVEATGDGDPTGKFHANLAILIDELGRVGESVPLFREALARATENGSRFLVINSAAALGNANRVLGEFDDAQRYLRQAVDLVDPATMSNDVDVPRFQLGVLWLTMGRWDDAVAEFDVAIAAADRLDSTRYQILARIRRAAVAHRRGEPADAHRRLSEAIELSVRHDHEILLVTARLQLAELLCGTGRQAEAAELLPFLPTPDDSEPDIEVRGDTARVRGLIAMGSPEPKRAVEYLEYALSQYRAMPSPPLQARVLSELSAAHHGAGDSASAERCRAEALAIHARLGIPAPDGTAFTQSQPTHLSSIPPNV